MKKIVLILLLSLSIGCVENVKSMEELLTAQEYIEKNNIEEWDLLWVSDSSGWGVAEIFGSYLEEDLGIKIKVMDKWQGGLAAGRILEGLRDGTTHNYDLDKLNNFIQEAEIIVIYGNPEESQADENPWDWNCGQSSMKSCYVNSCGMETFEMYIEHLKEIYSIIFSLREGQPTIIRAFDAYNPRIVQQCTPDGTFEICLECWENYNKAIHQAADEMGVPVAKVFDSWNGLDHSEDPNDKGYTFDGVHPNEKGAEVIAGLLRNLGYEFTIY